MGIVTLRLVKSFFIISLPTCIVSLLLLEGALRIVIPASNPPYSYFDSTHQLLKFDVSQSRDGYKSVGNFAQERTRWHVNNQGWNSVVDYEHHGEDSKIIAVIGDSMIQALDVDVEDGLPNKLRLKLPREYYVYSFAKGGGALSQFLHISRYVNAKYNPKIVIFNVEHRNFDQSLCDINSPVGMMCLRDDGDEIEESTIIPYVPSNLSRWARKSALIRYITFNLDFAVRTQGDDGSHVLGLGGSDESLDRYPDHELRKRVERSTNYILNNIAQENHDKTVVFMIDGLKRRDIYEGAVSSHDDFESWTHDLLKRLCREYDFAFLDLTQSFSESYRRTGLRFESFDNFHWNKHGHEVVANALLNKLSDESLLE